MKSMPPRARVVAWAAALFEATAGVLAGADSRAGGTPCPVHLDPPGSHGEWARAARAIEERLARAPAADCRSVLVQVTPSGATVLFATSDGRQAARRVLEPEALAPTVEALLVTLPVPPTTPPPSATRTELAPRPVAPTPPLISSSPGARSLRVIATATVGSRLGFSGTFWSSPLTVGASLVAGHWEAGIHADWEPVFFRLGAATPPGLVIHRYALGATAGRREPVGVAEVAAGAGGGIAAFDERGRADGKGVVDATGGGGSGDEPSSTGGDPADPFVGVYVGLRVPRRSWIRLRADLTSDVAVGRLGRGLVIDPALPSLPWLSVGASVGVEGEIP